MTSQVLPSSGTADYIVVGAGSAGCVVANRLSEDPSVSVLLIEAGGSDRSIFVRMPAAFALAISSSRFDWNYESDPEPGLGGRRLPCPRGKVLGGSSSINAMGINRGHRADFQRWADLAGPSWTYDNCLPYFKKMETFDKGGTEYRGGDGPLHVQEPLGENVLYREFLAACSEAGFPISDNTNGPNQEGFGPMDQNIWRGERCSTSVAYLHPVKARPNLTVLSKTLVRRIEFDGKRAVALEIERNGKVSRVSAGREIVLCAGAVNSAQLLLLSGAGPGKQLQELGIPVLHDSPLVGENLQDHVDVSVKRSCAAAVSETPLLRWYRKALIGAQWMIFKNGPGASNHF